jgi:RHS repeat-associated protein
LQDGRWVYYGNQPSAGATLASDRLGSVQTGSRTTYYPYGEERTATNNDTQKFATYTRDSATSLDYANARYYSSQIARFTTADPYQASGGPSDPQSWNRYAYVQGDPVNANDPSGNFLVACFSEDAETMYDGSCGMWGGGWGSGGWGAGTWFSSSDPNGDNSDGAVCDYEDPDPTNAWQGVSPEPGTPTRRRCSTPPPPKPKCDPRYQAWIDAYGPYAVATGLSVANVLALSVMESGWGSGRFAQEGNDFFNLETVWTPGTPMPGPKYAYQTTWLQAKEPFTTGPNKGKYSLVATYNSVSDSFKSFAATLGEYFQGVTDPAAFGRIAVAHGEYGGGGDFVNTALKFMDCLK